MGVVGVFDIRFVFCFVEEIDGFEEDDSEYEEVDFEDGEVFFVKDIDLEEGYIKVDEREEEVNFRE